MYGINSGGEGNIHWFNIVNSFLIVLFLTGMVGYILQRTVRRDVAKYNQLSQDEKDEID